MLCVKIEVQRKKDVLICKNEKEDTNYYDSDGDDDLDDGKEGEWKKLVGSHGST